MFSSTPSNKIFKIYRYVAGVTDKFTPPVDVNYKTGLITNLFPERCFVQGELTCVEWYANENKTDLVLEVDITYHRDPLYFAYARTTTRKWYLESGDIGANKITKKVYSQRESIVEGTTRRRNIYDIMMVPTMGLIAQTETAGDTELARQLGQAFLTEHKLDFDNFIDHSDPEILNTILNDTKIWLDNLIPDGGGATIRDYLFGEFDIWGS